MAGVEHQCLPTTCKPAHHRESESRSLPCKRTHPPITRIVFRLLCHSRSTKSATQPPPPTPGRAWICEVRGWAYANNPKPQGSGLACEATLGHAREAVQPDELTSPFCNWTQVEGFGAHTRTIQARHMVRCLLSETSLAGMI